MNKKFESAVCCAIATGAGGSIIASIAHNTYFTIAFSIWCAIIGFVSQYQYEPKRRKP